jgi:dTDP-4-dehydrorhamnose 3,5-epimerase
LYPDVGFTARAAVGVTGRDNIFRERPSMTFHETSLPGVFEIHLEPRQDERGFFARSWCREEFKSHGLNPGLVQCGLSFNKRKGTLRGLHYQAAPYQESKLVRCTRGAIYDVVVDLRAQSPSFKGWISALLTAANRHMLYVPEGCAHGFLTLEDETEVFYQMSEVYNAESARGVRWDDPAFRIDWPGKVETISERDRMYADFQ